MHEIQITEPERIFIPSGLEWLGIDIRGLDTTGAERLLIWAHKPEPASESGYSYGSISPFPAGGGTMHETNTIHVSPVQDFELRNEIDGQTDVKRIWILVDVSSMILNGIDFLLLYTEKLDVPGLRSAPYHSGR